MISVEERLAVVETLVTETRADVSEMKTDIKSLLVLDTRVRFGASLFTRAVAVLALVVSAITLALNMFAKGFHF